MNDARSNDQYFNWKEDKTPPTLWDRVQQGDDGAWSKLVQVWTPCIYNKCRLKGLNKQDAEDVTQRTLMRVFKFRDNFSREKEGYRLKHWLLTIINQSIADHFRDFKSKADSPGGTHHGELLANLPDGENDEEDEELFDPGLWMQCTLEMIKANVSPKMWDTFEMFKIQGHSAKEVAAHFEISENTVRQRVHTIVRLIKKEGEGVIDSLEFPE